MTEPRDARKLRAQVIREITVAPGWNKEDATALVDELILSLPYIDDKNARAQPEDTRTADPGGLREAAQAVVDAWVDDESGMETFDPALIDRLAAALTPEATAPDPATTRVFGYTLEEVREAIYTAKHHGWTPEATAPDQTADPGLREALTADTIAARSLYATGGNEPRPAYESGYNDGLMEAAERDAPRIEEVRRWVAAIGSTDLGTGRKVTKADALREIDRVLADLR